MTIKFSHVKDSEVEFKDPTDPVEQVVKHIHIVLPIVGAVLMFMLAFIAITMA
jgi:hypothetical protein